MQVARSSKVRQLAARAPYRAMYFHTRQSIMAAAAEVRMAVVGQRHRHRPAARAGAALHNHSRLLLLSWGCCVSSMPFQGRELN